MKNRYDLDQQRLSKEGHSRETGKHEQKQRAKQVLSNVPGAEERIFRIQAEVGWKRWWNSECHGEEFRYYSKQTGLDKVNGIINFEY